jgi:predicted AAA+ superfamily ATPase
MERTLLKDLRAWKDDPHRKPLLLRGARQVGKTWLMKHFAKDSFEDSVYVSFDNNKRVNQVFEPDLDPARILRELELIFQKKIKAGKTLLIFDEIQESPAALKSLKYFCEECPEYHIISAGSLLGVALHEGTSFPVGKVNFLDLGPLSFEEFLMAMNQNQLLDLLNPENLQTMRLYSHEFMLLLREYLWTGGMPEAVACFAETADFEKTHRVQQDIIDMYDMDFSKHAPGSQVPRIRQLWNSIPKQLAKDNHKFVYNIVGEGARAREYENAMLWILDTGIAHALYRVETIKQPLKAYEDTKSFKLYMNDIGLLVCMSGLTQETLFEGSTIFTEFKGALAEQFVMQELLAHGLSPFYWTNEKGRAELDFILQRGNNIIPLEVKSGLNLRAKSLQVYMSLYHPALAVRTSPADYKTSASPSGRIIDLPIYAIGLLGELLAPSSQSSALSRFMPSKSAGGSSSRVSKYLG